MKIQDHILALKNDNVPYRLFMPEGASKDYCVLWLQGWSSAMESHRQGVERMANMTNFVFGTMDYAGHGLHKQNPDETTRAQQHTEVVAVFDALTQMGFHKIVVIGGSFGAYMAALLAGKRPVHALILRAPANYPDEELDTPHISTLKWGTSSTELAARAKQDCVNSSTAIQSLKNFNGFTYVLEHELDEIVPREMPQAYCRAAAHGNYLIIPKTYHSPKLMKHPQAHFDYIEYVVCAILRAIELQDKLTTD